MHCVEPRFIARTIQFSQSELDYSGWIKIKSEYARACGSNISFTLSGLHSFLASHNH